MKSYLIALVDRFLPKIGLVRARLYRGQEAWIGFLESLTSAALKHRDLVLSERFTRLAVADLVADVVPPAKKVRKRAVKG